MTFDIERFLETLRETLPPVVARSRIEDYLGGVVAKGRMQNEDSAGTGPARFKIGKRGRVGYLREDLLQWLKEQLTD